MTTSLNSFNSSLLNLVRTHYKGPFQQKILEAFNSPQWDQDLGRACSAMFKISHENIMPPTPDMIEGYGEGNIGNDYSVVRFIDDRFGRILNIIREETIDFQVLKTYLDDISFLYGAKKASITRNLYYRKFIYQALANWAYWMHPEIFNAPLIEFYAKSRSKTPLSIEDTDSLSFLGICSLLNVFLTEQEKRIGRASYHPSFFKIDPCTSTQASWIFSQRFFPIEAAAKNRKFQNDDLFSYFYDFNDRYIGEKKLDLSLSLSNLLSSSSFLWDQEIFGIDPLQVEAMSKEERVRFLLSKKNALIEKCFSYLAKASLRSKELGPDFMLGGLEENPYIELQDSENTLRTKKLRALSIGRGIEEVLKEIEQLEKLLSHAIISKQNAKNHLIELIRGISGEINATQMEADLLKLLEGQELPSELLSTRTGKILSDLSNNYRKQTLLYAKYKEQLKEKGNALNPLKQQLEEVYTSLTNDYLQTHAKDQSMIHRLLEVHTVFSYFIFNQELFPDVSFSDLRKKDLTEKVAARKILSFFKKTEKQQFAAQEIEGTIEEFLNNTSKKIFERFRDYQQGKTRALTPAESKQILAVSREISESPQSLEKFQKFEQVLKTILIEDQSFVQNCFHLETSLPLQKIIQLQTYMNASLLFAEGQMATTATGLKRSIGFRQLIDAIQNAQNTDAIDTRAFESEVILKQLKNFDYPPEVTKSFTQNVQTAYNRVHPDILDQINLAANPIDINQFPQLQQKKGILEEIRQKILEIAPKGEGDYFSEKEKQVKPYFSPLKTQEIKEGGTVRASEAINRIFPSGSYLKKYLQDHYKGMLFSYDQLIEALRAFASREQENIGIFSSSEWDNLKRRFSGSSNLFRKLNKPQEIHLAVIVALYEQVRQEYHTQMRNLEKLTVTKFSKSMIPEEERMNVFEGVGFFRHYKKKSDSFSMNYEKSENLYQQFLPLFLTSYLADTNNLNEGRVYLSERKLEALKELFPGVERVYGEMSAFLTSQSRQFTEMKEFFKEQESQAGFLEEGFLNSLKDFIRQNFNPFPGIEEFAFTSTIASLGLLLYTRSPIFSTLGGLAIGYFWKTKTKPFLSDMYNLLLEGGKDLLGYNSPAGINDYILNVFQVAFQTEINLAQTQNLPGRTLEINSLFLNSLFLQEEFSILKNSRISLLEFRNRLESLAPYAVENTNFSVMILNLFFKMNEPGFLAAPNDLLRNAGHPLFIPALKEYFTAYQNLLSLEKAKFIADGHTEEECVLTLGIESPFKSYLTEQAKKGELMLNFSMNSSVYQFMGTQYFYLENPFRSQIEPTQINQGLPSFARNLEAFMQTAQKSLALEEQFLGAIRPVLLRTQKLLELKPSHVRNAQETLRSNYHMLRFVMSAAREMDQMYFTTPTNTVDYWMSSTNERGQSLFLSPLYREISSNLMKTAQFMAISGAKEGENFLNAMRELESRVAIYLKGGEFLAPKLESIQQIEAAVGSLLSDLEKTPQVAFPILYEKAKNPESELPVFAWRWGMESLNQEMQSTENAITLRDANKSNLIYLTNEGLEIFFTTPSTRGFSLSPMTLNALENAFKQNTDQSILLFLGVMAQRDQTRLRSLQQIPRSIDVQALQQESYRSLARQRGQPLMLMPLGQQGQQAPASGTTASQQLPQQQAVSNQQLPQTSGPNPYIQSVPQVPSSSYISSTGGSPMIQGQQNIQQPSGTQNQPIGWAEGPIGAIQGSPRRGNQEEQSGSNFMPIFMPYGQSSRPQVNSEDSTAMPQQQEQTVTPQVQEQAVSQPVERNYVTVTSDGSTAGTVSATEDASRNPWSWADEEIARSDRLIAERAKNPPQIELPGPPPSSPYRGPMNMQDYWNYQEEVNASRQVQFPYGKAAAVGGSLMLGAALLAQMMKKDKKEGDK